MEIDVPSRGPSIENNCLACELTSYLQREHMPVLAGTSIADQVETQVVALSDPGLHTFSDDCQLDLPDGYTKEELLELSYEIETSQRAGRLDVDINVVETDLKEFEVTVDVGGVDQ